jgi:hypothetical protein
MPRTSTQRREPHGEPARAPGSASAPAPHGKRARRAALNHYIDASGVKREIIVRRGARRKTLVIDRQATGRHDPRLVAALEPDEPPENAAIVCDLYLADPSGRYARPVTGDDLLLTAAEPSQSSETASERLPDEIHDRAGNRYRIETVEKPNGDQRLRWTQAAPGAPESPATCLSLREVVGSMQDYQPAVAITERAISTGTQGCELASELRRLRDTPIVLNRRLREAVLATIEREGLSMSQIALRCGHVKRDRKGNESGETSWLARRLGLMTEAGRSTPGQWIHSDVLAAIARAVGLNPGEVET